MFPKDMKTISDFQEFHKWLDETKGFGSDLLFNYVLLTGEVGEVAQVLKKIRWRAAKLETEIAPEQAPAIAMGEYRQELAYELADCISSSWRTTRAST
ncbi:MAG: MazG-like family protein [Symbiobacteriia bacterium]